MWIRREVHRYSVSRYWGNWCYTQNSIQTQAFESTWDEMNNKLVDSMCTAVIFAVDTKPCYVWPTKIAPLAAPSPCARSQTDVNSLAKYQTSTPYSPFNVDDASTLGQWRLVIDFQNLDKGCSTERWPILDKKEILQRIGDKRPKIFNVMDLTSGYYQAPIAEECCEFTAVMTHISLNELELVHIFSKA